MFPWQNNKVCVSSQSLHTHYPDPGSYIDMSENVITRAVFFSSAVDILPPLVLVVTPAPDCRLRVLSKRFFTRTATSLHVLRHHLTSHIYSTLLIAHDSVLHQQKGTEASATLIIGHMIDKNITIPSYSRMKNFLCIFLLYVGAL